jgi:hypothetical protein
VGEVAEVAHAAAEQRLDMGGVVVAVSDRTDQI